MDNSVEPEEKRALVVVVEGGAFGGGVISIQKEGVQGRQIVSVIPLSLPSSPPLPPLPPLPPAPLAPASLPCRRHGNRTGRTPTR